MPKLSGYPPSPPQAAPEPLETTHRMEGETPEEHSETSRARICEADGVMTLVNVFTVRPDRQEELIELLVRATEETMRHLPGFVSANIHRGSDGTRVVNYAQWRSRADFEAMLRNPEARPHMELCAAMAEFDPITCEVVHVDSGVA